ncbi:putative late blight resistance protein homolog R1A-3 [Coffea eugenioides]|uniref:putative late blight resistance protein homolog R1A-3 n=1 Tax=Coffea eugenioides TaxID=49369 RepID=UPI000F614A66|nr:putative late blight resistance protein homolog R1A-3 [Coffea eugenioides]
MDVQELLDNNAEIDAFEQLLEIEDNLEVLKLELRLVRTFFICARILWSNPEPAEKIIDREVRLGSFLFSLQDSVQKNAMESHSLSLRLEEDAFSLLSDAFKLVQDCQNNIYSFKQDFDKFYVTLLGCLSQSSSAALRDHELMEFMDSLLENLVNILLQDDCYGDVQLLIHALQEKIKFLKSFIVFAIYRGVEERQLADVLAHSQVVAVNAAYLSCLCWFDKDEEEVHDKVKLKISDLLDGIKPIDPRAHEIYIQVLTTPGLSGSPPTLNLVTISSVLGDFVDSLLGNIWDLLHCGRSFMVSMKILYEGLRFLRTILKNQQVKFDELDEQMIDLIVVVVNEAGIIICSLFPIHIAKGMDLAVTEFLEKIKLVKADLAPIYPRTSIFSFPSTRELDFIDLLLENLKGLANNIVYSVSLTKDRVQEVEEDLEFLKSRFENVAKYYNQHEKPQVLWSSIIEVTIRAEFVIHSLRGGDLSDSCCIPFNTIAEDIKLIKAEVLEIDDQEQGFISKKAVKISSSVPSESGISKTNEVMVALSDQIEIVTTLLVRGSKKLEIVSILGMPGLGKTTLAKKLYNDPSVRCHFHTFAWSTVSQVYNGKNLLLEILVCIVPKLSEQYAKMKEVDLVEELYKRLKRNRYLIILDDLWDGEAWTLMEKSFPDDANGSRILLTSRNHKVALHVGPTNKLHHLRSLTDEESWELLRKKVFHNEECPPALHELGVQIAKNCKGLPLIVIIIAGILATREPDGWEEVAQRLSSYTVLGTEECRDILELSYRNLPDYLQRCLLYFGAFKEDQEIPIWRLKYLWIAEGFVQETEMKSLEDVAEEYMIDLTDRSLVMVAKRRSLGKIKTCHIHDLLHEFCVLKAKEENFLRFLHGNDDSCIYNVSSNIHRLGIHSKLELFERSILFCPRLRCLLLSADGCRYPFQQPNISFVFHIFKLLRVLDLGQFNVGDCFPSEVELLVELRFLAIKGTMRSIPSSIANLSNLETFLLDSNDAALPDTILNMNKLRHLHTIAQHTRFSFEKVNLDSSSILHSLDTLSTAWISYGQGIEKIVRKFPNIRELKCELDYEELAASTENRGSIVDLSFLNRLESLNIIHDDYATICKIEYHFPLNLKKLTLSYFPCGTVSTLGKLPNLEVLNLSYGPHDWKIWEMKEGEFPKLKTLRMGALCTLRWIGCDDSLPCLEKLVLSRCEKLTEIPSCLWYASTLEVIMVQQCSDFLTSLVCEIEDEQRSMGNEDLKVHIIPEEKSGSEAE